MPALKHSRDERIGRVRVRGDIDELRRQVRREMATRPEVAVTVAAHLEITMRALLEQQTHHGRADGRGFARIVSGAVLRTRALARHLGIPQREIDRARQDIAQYDRTELHDIIDGGWPFLMIALEERRPSWQR